MFCSLFTMPPKRDTPNGRTTKTNDNNKKTNNKNNNDKTSNNLKQQQRYDTKSFKAEMKKFDTFKKTNTDFASLDYCQIAIKNRNPQEECSELDENSILNANNILCYITTLDTIGMNPYKDDSMDITVDPTPSEVPTVSCCWLSVLNLFISPPFLFISTFFFIIID